MSTPQQPLQIGDRVEVVGDRRAFLNGRQGTIFDIIGDRVYVGFATNIPSERRAVFHADKLKKVERKP